MTTKSKVSLIGGGIGNLAAAAFLIRDGHLPGANITVFETLPAVGGSLDGAGDAAGGYSMRGGRMLTTDNYECTWDLFKSIPSLERPGKTVFEETVEFNSLHVAHSRARLVDRRRAIVPVESMGFSMRDRLELLQLIRADETELGAARITDRFSPGFFETPFWMMWSTTFAFQPWHSAVELKRYCLRFLLEFNRIETLAGVKRTIYNQYDSLVRPLVSWLTDQGVRFELDCAVTALQHRIDDGDLIVTGIVRGGKTVLVGSDDYVFLQNGSMTDSSSLGSMTAPPAKLTKRDGGGWSLWEELAAGHPEFGRPEVFNRHIAESYWESFTVTLHDTAFFDAMEKFSGNEAGTGGLVTFQDSNWLLSVVLAHQPHFLNQPSGVQVFWGYALFPDRIGNFVAKPMSDCTGAEILTELIGHLRFEEEVFATANCVPCRMPYLTSMFSPRVAGDRPLPVPRGTRNLALVSQFVEIPDDVVFTVEYSVRAAQMAVYELMRIALPIPPVTPHARSLYAEFEAVVKAFR